MPLLLRLLLLLPLLPLLLLLLLLLRRRMTDYRVSNLWSRRY
jgi:hypothetical protein